MTGDLKLRPATAADADRVLSWANDPDVRAASFATQSIDGDTHRAWFARSLAGARRLLIGELAGDAVGLLRLDPIDEPDVRGVAEVSITVAPGRRGAGVGRSLLTAGIDEASVLGLYRLRARVRRDNAASRRLFEGAGFRLVDEGEVDGVSALIFERETAND